MTTQTAVTHEGRIRMILDGPDEGDWIGYCTGCDWHTDPRPINHTLGEAARDHERTQTVTTLKLEEAK